MFDEYWNKIIREINLNDSFDYSSSNKTANNTSSFSYFTDFLICSSSNKAESQKNNFKSTNNFNRNNISKLSIRHKNIINSFLDTNENNLIRKNKSHNSLHLRSKENTEYSTDGQKWKRKANKNKPRLNLDNNISLIYWEDDSSCLNNGFSDFGVEHSSLGALGLNIPENEKILIMNVENNLLFLELNNLECVYK